MRSRFRTPIRRVVRRAALALSLLAGASGAQAQQAWELDQARTGVAPVGDLDADGAPDFALASRAWKPHIASPRNEGRKPPIQDRVWIVSGGTGRALRSLAPPRAASDFGRLIADAGDLDRDGQRELAVSGGGVLWVYSGRSGELLHELGDSLAGPGFACDLSAGLDADGDRVPDLAVYRSPCPRGLPSEGGLVGLYSGATGKLWRVFGTRATRSMWSGYVAGHAFVEVDAARLSGALALSADRDGDGCAELALATQGTELASKPDTHGHEPDNNENAIAVLDPLDGKRYVRFPLAPERAKVPWLLRALTDLDADGIDELGLTYVHEYASIYSGKSGRELRHEDWVGAAMDGEGTGLEVLGDANADEVADYLVAANEDGSIDCGAGYAELRCGRSGALLARLDLVREALRGRATAESRSRCGPGADVCALGDLDGDRVPDVLVAISHANQVRILSGASFRELRRYEISAIASSAGAVLTSEEPARD